MPSCVMTRTAWLWEVSEATTGLAKSQRAKCQVRQAVKTIRPLLWPAVVHQTCVSPLAASNPNPNHPLCAARFLIVVGLSSPTPRACMYEDSGFTRPASMPCYTMMMTVSGPHAKVVGAYRRKGTQANRICAVALYDARFF